MILTLAVILFTVLGSTAIAAGRPDTPAGNASQAGDVSAALIDLEKKILGRLEDSRWNVLLVVPLG